MANDVTSITKSLDRIADALEGGGSGGGSSDFTMAHVTVNNLLADTVEMVIPAIVDDSQLSALSPFVGIGGYSQTEINVALYKGNAACFDLNEHAISVVSGDAEENDGSVLIKGDCVLQIGE